VTRAADSARVNRGWSIPRIAKESGVGVNTLYRWKRGEWTASPDADLVEKFCDTLGIPTEAAFRILWPGKTGRPTTPEPAPTDPDVDTLLRQLNDPNVSESEKYLIRETIRSLAARAPRRRTA
jgi:transcriptional regulator with XRE-family HTH domain